MPDLPVPADYTQALGATTPTHSADHDAIRDKVDDAADDITAVEADVTTAQNDITDLETAKVPIGGSTAQVLAKTAPADYAMAWTTVGAGGPVVAADVGVDDVLWQNQPIGDVQEALDDFEGRIFVGESYQTTNDADILQLQTDLAAVNDLPAGGGTGQALVKTGPGDYAVGWDDVEGAPTGADYLVGTLQGGLSNEIVVGATPQGELGGVWSAPTVDALHSGSYHPEYHIMTASFTATPASMVDIVPGSGPDLVSGLLPAASTWEFEIVLAGKLNGNTNGVKFQVHLSAGTGGGVNGTITGYTGSATNDTTTRLYALDTVPIGPGGGDEVWWKQDNIELGAVFKGILIVGNADASFGPRINRVSGGTITVRPSHMKLTRVV